MGDLLQQLRNEAAELPENGDLVLRAADAIERLTRERDSAEERSKACDQIADGDYGWENLRPLCVATMSVCRLRSDYERLTRELDDRRHLTAGIIEEKDRLRAALERITECTEERDGGEGIQVITGSSRDFWYAVIAAKELTHGRPATETAAGLNGWRPIDTVPAGEHLFWVVPKSAGEGYTDTNGNPILSTHAPYIHFGHHGTWSSLSKATHWMPAPVSPLNGDGGI